MRLAIFPYNKDTQGYALPFYPELSSDTVVSLSRDIFELEDISRLSTENSYIFSLAGSTETRKFFRQFGTLNFIGSTAYQSYKAEIHKDGVMVFSGRIILKYYDSNKNEYSVQLMGNLSFVKNTLANRKIRDASGLAQYNHEYSGASETIIKSWTGECQRSFSDTTAVNSDMLFFYPVVDSMGMGYYHNENIQQNQGDDTSKYVPFQTALVADAAPTGGIDKDNLLTPFNGATLPMAVKYVPLIKALLEEAGFTVSMDHYEQGNKWPNLYILTPTPEEGDEFMALTASLGLSNNQEGGFAVTTVAPNVSFPITYNTSDKPILRDGYKYTVITDGNYSIDVAAALTATIDYTEAGGICGEARIYMKLYHYKAASSTSFEISTTGYIKQDGTLYFIQPFPDVDIVGAKTGDYFWMGVVVTLGGSGCRADITYSIDKNLTHLEVTKAPTSTFPIERTVGQYFGDTMVTELLGEFLKLSKATVECTGKDGTQLDIVPLLNNWRDNSVPQLDITDKIDRTSKFEVRPATELMPKSLNFRWKESESVLGISYKAKVGQEYGATDDVSALPYGGKDYKIESNLFAPFIAGGITLSSGGMSEIIVLKAFKDIDKFDKDDRDYRLFLWDQKVRTGTDEISISKFAAVDPSTTTTFPMAHNLLLTASTDVPYAVYDTTDDINWEWSVPYTVDSYRPTNIKGNQLFDMYYRRFIDALYSYDTVIIDTNVYLTAVEFSRLNIWAPVMLDGSRYRILSYTDYDLRGNETMGIRLLKDNVGQGVTAIEEVQVTIDATYLVGGVINTKSVTNRGDNVGATADQSYGGALETVKFESSIDTLKVPASTSASVDLPVGTYGTTIADFDTAGVPTVIYSNNGVSVELTGLYTGLVLDIIVSVLMEAGQGGNPTPVEVNLYIKNAYINSTSSLALIGKYSPSIIDYYSSFTEVAYSSIVSTAVSYMYMDSARDDAGMITLSSTENMDGWETLTIEFEDGGDSMSIRMKDLSVDDYLSNGKSVIRVTSLTARELVLTLEKSVVDNDKVIADIDGMTYGSLEYEIKVNNTIDVEMLYYDSSQVVRTGTAGGSYSAYVTPAFVDAEAIVVRYVIVSAEYVDSEMVLNYDSTLITFDSTVAVDDVIYSGSGHNLIVSQNSGGTILLDARAKLGTFGGAQETFSLKGGPDLVEAVIRERAPVAYQIEYNNQYTNTDKVSGDVLHSDSEAFTAIVSDYAYNGVGTPIIITMDVSTEATILINFSGIYNVLRPSNTFGAGNIIASNSEYKLVVDSVTPRAIVFHYILKTVLASSGTDSLVINAGGTTINVTIEKQAIELVKGRVQYYSTEGSTSLSSSPMDTSDKSRTSKRDHSGSVEVAGYINLADVDDITADIEMLIGGVSMNKENFSHWNLNSSFGDGNMEVEMVASDSDAKTISFLISTLGNSSDDIVECKFYGAGGIQTFTLNYDDIPIPLLPAPTNLGDDVNCITTDRYIAEYTWDAVTGADHYIFNGDGKVNFSTTSTVANTLHIGDLAQTVNWTVRAVDGTGVEGLLASGSAELPNTDVCY